MAYSGSWRPKNIEKYKGNTNNITFRSLWEKKVMDWLDLNPDVVQWNSEEIVIPYICKTDGRAHRYFTDFYIVFKSGSTIIVEVKPSAQTTPPKPKQGKAKAKLIHEGLTYAKNYSKWCAAEKYCEERGWKFQIWSEEVLKKIGIQIGGTKFTPRKKLNG